MRKTLYITKSGTFKRRDNTLFFVDHEGKRVFIPVEDTNDIFIFSEVDLNTRLLDFLTQKRICVHFLNYYGYYSGTYYPREHLNSGYMILQQSKTYNDRKQRLALAKKFVIGAMDQMIQVLKYYRRRREKKELFDQAIKDIGINKRSLDGVTSIAKLMAYEGLSKEKYYHCFDEIILNNDFIFEKRTKRPPLNRLNALISFGNTLCYTVVLSEIYKTFLDPRIGFLHSTNFRRFSLNLDIAEIFKPLIVDRLIFLLINKKIITKNSFDEIHGGGILLNEHGRRTFIQHFEEKMRTTIHHRHLGRNVSYRRLVRLELYKVQKHLMEEKEFKPYVSRW